MKRNFDDFMQNAAENSVITKQEEKLTFQIIKLWSIRIIIFETKEDCSSGMCIGFITEAKWLFANHIRTFFETVHTHISIVEFYVIQSNMLSKNITSTESYPSFLILFFFKENIEVAKPRAKHFYPHMVCVSETWGIFTFNQNNLQNDLFQLLLSSRFHSNLLILLDILAVEVFCIYFCFSCFFP